MRPSGRTALHRWGARLAVAVGLYFILAYVVLPRLWIHHEHQPGLATKATVTQTADGIPGDPLNVGLVGDKTDVMKAMAAAGWVPADPITLRSSIAISASVVLDRPDDDAPVSPLYYDGAQAGSGLREGDRAQRRQAQPRALLASAGEGGRGSPRLARLRLSGRGRHAQPRYGASDPPHLAQCRRRARPAHRRSRRREGRHRALPSFGRRADDFGAEWKGDPLLHRRRDPCRGSVPQMPSRSRCRPWSNPIHCSSRARIAFRTASSSLLSPDREE